MLFVRLVTSGHVVGRQAIVVHDVVVPLSRLFDDDENIVRKNAHLAIEMISENNIGLCIHIIAILLLLLLLLGRIALEA